MVIEHEDYVEKSDTLSKKSSTLLRSFFTTFSIESYLAFGCGVLLHSILGLSGILILGVGYVLYGMLDTVQENIMKPQEV